MPDEPPFREQRGTRIGDLIHMVVAAITYRRTQALARRSRHLKAMFAHDLIGVHINAFGVYEGDSLDLVFDFLSSREYDFAGGAALDIGANIGNHALYFAERFAEIIAYEPHPVIGDVLAFNAKQAGNVSVRRYGLGDEPGTFTQSSVAGNLGASSLSPEAKGTTVDVEVRRLDDETFARLDLIKIDVEGFEEKVLRGAAATLTAHRPVILFEQNADEFDDDGSASLRVLRELGYRVFWIEGGRDLSASWLRQGLQMLTAIVLGRRRHVVSGPNVPRRDHAFLIALPE